MSAVYLHNSIYNQEAPSNFPHSRNLSTISSATLQTNTTLHSQPHEPLLPQSSPPQDSYYDTVSQNTRPHFVPHVTQERDFSDNTAVESEKSEFLPRRRPRSRMRWLKFGFDALISIWALYNAVRYFLAFTIYDTDTGESAALALGICTSLSFSFLACAFCLSAFRTQLLRHGMADSVLSVVSWVLIYPSLFLLFAPAAANFAFVFAWRDSTDLQLRPKLRCHIDIDLTWSVTQRMCKTNSIPWGVWVTLSTLRLTLTSLILAGYLYILHKLEAQQLVSERSTHRGKHRINPSDTFSFHSALPPTAAAARGGTPFPAVPSSSPLRPSIPHRPSDSSISSRTKISSYRPKMRRSRSSGLSADGALLPPPPPLLSMSEIAAMELPRPLPVVHEDRFSSLLLQIDRETDAAVEFARSEETSSQHTLGSSINRASGGSDADEEDEGDDDEEALHDTRHNHTQNTRNQFNPTARIRGDDDNDDDDGNDRYDDEDDFYRASSISAAASGSRLPSLGFNEFGQPYPPDEDIPMLNGYIRRMPTIESMGSREMATSSIAGSSLFSKQQQQHQGTDNKRGSVQTNKSSRPPTRNATRASWVGSEFSTGSELSSRTNSLSVQVEKLAAMGVLSGGGGGGSQGHAAGGGGGAVTSEMGELMVMDVTTSSRRAQNYWPESPSSSKLAFGLSSSVVVPPPPSSPSEVLYSSSTSGSRSTNVSYFTATTRSGGSEGGGEVVGGVAPLPVVTPRSRLVPRGT